MGYRHHIGVLDKFVHEKIKGLTYRQLVKKCNPSYDKEDPDDLYVSSSDLPIHDLYELGKYVETDYLIPFKSEVFTRPSVNKRFNEDTELYIISQEGFKAIIESYRDRIISYYEKLSKDTSLASDDIKSKIREWKNAQPAPYNLDSDDPDIINSWLYEYAIFELVRIYKSIDWETQLITITAG